MSAININKNNFQNEIMDSEKTVLLDFWAPWCAPCRMVVPIIEEIAGERPDIKVGKINVDEQPELASKFGIMSIPTLVVMKNGKIVTKVSGSRSSSFIIFGSSGMKWMVITKIEGSTMVRIRGTIKRAKNSLRLAATPRKSFLMIAYMVVFISLVPPFCRQSARNRYLPDWVP